MLDFALNPTRWCWGTPITRPFPNTQQCVANDSTPEAGVNWIAEVWGLLHPACLCSGGLCRYLLYISGFSFLILVHLQMFDQVWTSTKKTIKKQFNKWVWNTIWRVRLYTNYVLDFKNEQSFSFFFISLRRSWKESSGVQTAYYGRLSRQPPRLALSHTVLFSLKCPLPSIHWQKWIYLLGPGSSNVFTSKPLIILDRGKRNLSLSYAGGLPISQLSHNNIRSFLRTSHVPDTVLSALHMFIQCS